MANNLFLRHIQYRHRIRFKHKVIANILYWFDRIVFSTEIPSGVDIRYGTSFPHLGLGIVLHNRTIIGRFCKLYQNITIGSRNSIGPAIIEDNVLIGAGAIILGRITIGRASQIGAGAVVTKDVPPYSVVVGNPGIVLHLRFSQEIIDKLENIRWWEFSDELLEIFTALMSKNLSMKDIEEFESQYIH